MNAPGMNAFRMSRLSCAEASAKSPISLWLKPSRHIAMPCCADNRRQKIGSKKKKGSTTDAEDWGGRQGERPKKKRKRKEKM